MPDRSTFWSPVPDWSKARLDAEGLRVQITRPAAMQLISGALDALPAELGVDGIRGPREPVNLIHYALRLAPDRLLRVSDTPLSPGWHAPGLAVTDIGDGYVCIDLSGTRARELLACGTEYDFNAEHRAPLESAHMLLGGLRVAVARHDAGWRLHVERPWAAALWQWLEACVEPWADRY